MLNPPIFKFLVGSLNFFEFSARLNFIIFKVVIESEFFNLRNTVFLLDTTKLFCFVYTTVNDIIEGISIILLHSLMFL